MNQLIKEIALQCGAYHQVYDQKNFMINENFDIEKFSNSIIQQCLTICEKIGDRGMDGHYCADEIVRIFK